MSPSGKARLFHTWWRVTVGLREAVAPIRRAAAARLALIMAARWEYEAANKHSDDQKLRCAVVETLLETSNHVGWGRGMVAELWRPALPLSRCLSCLTRDYVIAAPGVRAYG